MPFKNRWISISITKRLYSIIALMTFLIMIELLTLKFAMTTMSAGRAFVGSEGTWSKAQKNAAFNLQYYAWSHDEKDYNTFLKRLQIPEGLLRARLAIFNKPHPDLEVARQGFLVGHIHPKDIDPMINLLLRFHDVCVAT
jgi:hypothetical protein